VRKKEISDWQAASDLDLNLIGIELGLDWIGLDRKM
jgi:hypothetical protein